MNNGKNKMTRCKGKNKKGVRCSHKIHYGYFCDFHTHQRCKHKDIDHERCNGITYNNGYCRRHIWIIRFKNELNKIPYGQLLTRIEIKKLLNLCFKYRKKLPERGFMLRKLYVVLFHSTNKIPLDKDMVDKMTELYKPMIKTSSIDECCVCFNQCKTSLSCPCKANICTKCIFSYRGMKCPTCRKKYDIRSVDPTFDYYADIYSSESE